MNDNIQEERRIHNPSAEAISDMNAALESAGLNWLTAARLALELAESGGGRRQGNALLRRCRHIITLGNAAAADERRSSVSFRKAAEAHLLQRAQRRPRTRAEIAGFCRALMQRNPQLADRRIRGITPADCAALLQCFTTPRQREKGRIILHGLFSHALRQGWCDTNPAAALPKEWLPEQEIQPLCAAELRSLLRAAQRPAHRACMPALGLMLWAGVRPAEIRRLTWADINREEKVISIRPHQAKTGGCRHITLFPVLERWLALCGFRKEGPLCPTNWPHRWHALRARAGLLPWRQDVLRHTFASYHAKMYRNFPALQAEMGHRSAELLRTRYLNMRGLNAADARRFWNGDFFRS